ncbi:adenosylcobinamide-phosphate synthase CbiB [Oscillospiraceae bacterium PP1C4]
MFYSISVIVYGFLLDLIFGDPHWMPHPVRWIGSLIALLEKPVRAIFPKNAKGEKIGGAVLTALTVGLTAIAAVGVLWLAGHLGNLVAYAVEVLMCYQLFAARSLHDESMKVFSALKKGDLAAARTAVSMIVGRDTDRLTPTQVTKAAVETVAENTSDGVIAPLFFVMIGGAPLGFCYKAINTLDSMIGYKNDRYLNFGCFAAKLDDVVNFIPARISALLMVCAAFLCGLDGRGGYRIWKRDRRNHASPNSAQTEAVCAGALGIQLAGDAVYGGVVFHKQTIGDDLRPVATNDIRLANRLMYLSAIGALVVFSAIKLLIIFVS